MIPITIETTHTGAAALSKRSRRLAFRNMRYAIAKYWRNKLLWFHFRPSAKVKYKHRRRTNRTTRRKKALAEIGLVKKDGRVDLVWSGNLEKSLVNVDHEIKAFPTRASVKMVGTKYFGINYKPGRPNIGREVTAYTEHEVRLMDEQGTKTLDKEVHRLGKSSRRRHKAT